MKDGSFTGFIFYEDGEIDKDLSSIKYIYGLPYASLDEIMLEAISYFEDGDMGIDMHGSGVISFTAKDIRYNEGQMTFPETGQWDFPPYWEMNVEVDKIEKW